MLLEDENSGKSSEPEISEQTGSQPEQDTGSKAESTTAKAEAPVSMGDALKAEMARINDASQERLEKPAEEPGKEESPASETSGKDSDAEDAEDRTGDDGADEQKKVEAEAEKDWLDKQKPETAKRFQELTGKLKSVNQEVAQLREQVEQSGAAVQRMEAFNRWVNEEAGFTTTQQWNEFLQMGALINNNPAAALEKIDQYRAQLAESLGLAGNLPEDIQRRLDEGLIDENSARELAKERLLREGESTRQQRQAELRQQREAQRAHTDRVKSVADAVRKAESAWQKADPDYETLAPEVKDKVIALLQRERANIQTPKDAVDLFNRAVESVKKLAKLGQRQREITQPGTGAGSGQRIITESQPKTLVGALKKAYRESHEPG